jgi:hypothetical protein
MMLKTFASAAALLLSLSPLSLASAQTPPDDVFVFETVDSYDLDSYIKLKVTGILQGEALPRTISFENSWDANYQQQARTCERLALIAMSKPGQYYLELRRIDYRSQLVGCKLTRR